VRYCAALRRAVTLRQGAPDECRRFSGRSAWRVLGTAVFLATAAGRLRAGRRLVSAAGGRSRSRPMAMLLGDSLLLCALQMSCLEVRVAPTDRLARCGPHHYPLSLAATDPISLGAAVVSVDWLALTPLCRSTRSW
jgi:hypothetical protein